MSTTPTWTMDGLRAQLRNERFTASMDLEQPELGLGAPQWPHGRLLGVACADDSRMTLVQEDIYVRDGDLVAAYMHGQSPQFRMQIYWRWLDRATIGETPGAHGDELVALELQVSVQTELLDSWPEVHTQTELLGGDVAQVAAGEVQQLPTDAQRVAQFAPAGRRVPRIALFRPRDATTSYVEIVHPADVSHIEDEATPARGAVPTASDAATVKSPSPREGALLRHRLFAEHLEKGVIRRARIRGVIGPRQQDVEWAVACAESFSGTAPPLTA